MTDSILDSVKEALGIMTNQSDAQLLTQVNHAFLTLNQMGVGPVEVFSIADSQPVWSDFFTCSPDCMNDLQTYLILTVRLVLFPPATPVLDAYKEQIKYSSWRLKMATT